MTEHPIPTARCGRTDPHGAHAQRDTFGTFCAGSLNVIEADTAPELPPDAYELAKIERERAADLRRRETFAVQPAGPPIDAGPACPECGHPEHETNADPSDVLPCPECDDAAQVGTYAPCQTVDPAYTVPPALARLAALAPRDPLAHYDDCPTEAHTHDAWTDDDTVELAAAMRDAAWTTADRHSEARMGGNLYRTFANDPRYRPIDQWATSYTFDLRNQGRH